MTRIIILAFCTAIFGCNMSDNQRKYSRSQCIVLLDIKGKIDDRNAIFDETREAALDKKLGLAAMVPKYKDNEIVGLYLQYKSSCEEKVNLTETLIRTYLESAQLEHLSFNISEEIVNPSVDTIDVRGRHWVD